MRAIRLDKHGVTLDRHGIRLSDAQTQRILLNDVDIIYSLPERIGAPKVKSLFDLSSDKFPLVRPRPRI